MITIPYYRYLLIFLSLLFVSNSFDGKFFGTSPPMELQNLLKNEMDGKRLSSRPIILPCCYDGISARLVARSKKSFEATFMTGFGVSGSHGHPDTQLLSCKEMMDAANSISEGLSSGSYEKGQRPIPCIADGDTGYGNVINIKRLVFGYAKAGMAGIMIEDQVQPKRCGHVHGKSVISMKKAIKRVQAACDARDEYEFQYGTGTGPLILARTDSLSIHGLNNAIERLNAFRHVGCDMTFLEAPENIQQMEIYCRTVSGPKLANMLEYGLTPVLTPEELKNIGYTMVAYPLTLLSSSIKAMKQSLDLIYSSKQTNQMILTFDEIKDEIGFNYYNKESERYKV